MSSRYKWALVALLWVVALLNYVDRQVVFSVFPLLQSEFRVSSLELGLLGTVFLWVYGVLSPLGGYLADRFSRRAVILASLVVWSVVTFLTGLARGYGDMVAARALMGISEACYLPAALALIADYHDERTRSLATGFHQSGLYVGIILGGAGGGWIGQHYGWRAAFLSLGVVGVIYGLALAGMLKEAPRPASSLSETPQFGTAMRRLAGSRSFLLLLTANSLASMAYWMVYTWLPLFLYERFRMSLAAAGFSATFYIQAASFAGILAGGWWADRWSRSQPRARLLVQTVGFGLAAPCLFLVGTVEWKPALVAALLLFGAGRGFFDCNLMPVVCQVVKPHLRATAYGMLNFASCIMGGAMTAAAGAVKGAIGLGGALQISALMLVAAAVLLTRIGIGNQQWTSSATSKAD